MKPEQLKPWHVEKALQVVAESWPPVVRPARGRPFRKSAALNVLMALHRRYNWDTFAIAIPVAYRRARPATDVDFAAETGLSRQTVGIILAWLTDEQAVLLTRRGHGWTGGTVRAFNVSLLLAALGWAPDREGTGATPSRSRLMSEPEGTGAQPEGTAAVRLEDRNQKALSLSSHETTSGDNALWVETSENGLTADAARNGGPSTTDDSQQPRELAWNGLEADESGRRAWRDIVRGAPPDFQRHIKLGDVFPYRAHDLLLLTLKCEPNWVVARRHRVELDALIREHLPDITHWYVRWQDNAYELVSAPTPNLPAEEEVPS